MPPASVSQIEVRRARPDECRDVLAMSLASPAMRPDELALQVEAFAAHARALSLDLGRQWVASVGAGARTGCTCIHSPGRTALLMIPSGVVALTGEEAAAHLVRCALEDASAAGARLVQCVLNPAETGLLESLLVAEEFVHLARLHYLELLSLSKFVVRPPPRSVRRISWRAYSEATHALFLEILEQTYRDSRDCPALTGLRTVSDALAGHRAAGYFRPERWLVLETEQGAVGCVLLNEVPLRAALEVVYMGLVPAARGCGLAYVLISQAVEFARREGFTSVCLAVDAANEAAGALYARAGFQPVIEKDVWIRVLDARTER